MKKNNNIIPLGEECYTCQSLDTKFSNNSIRKCSFPFDYVGHTYIENIYNNMFDLLNSNSNYHCDINDFSKQLFNDKYFLCHNKYNFKYWHDIYSYDNIINPDDEEIKNFINKYNRRYERLKCCLKNNNNNNITILSVNHFDNIYNKENKQESVYKLFNLLQTHNPTINFIAINFGEELYNIPNLNFVNLNVNYNLSFIESKQDFTKELYEYINTSFKI